MNRKLPPGSRIRELHLPEEAHVGTLSFAENAERLEADVEPGETPGREVPRTLLPSAPGKARCPRDFRKGSISAGRDLRKKAISLSLFRANSVLGTDAPRRTAVSSWPLAAARKALEDGEEPSHNRSDPQGPPLIFPPRTRLRPAKGAPPIRNPFSIAGRTPVLLENLERVDVVDGDPDALPPRTRREGRGFSPQRPGALP